MISKRNTEIAFVAMLLCAVPLFSLELEPALREAEMLYQSGRYQDAAIKAAEIHRFFPDDLQTLLVLGMSDFNAGNYLKAADWFKMAHRLSPRHPLVVRYTTLLREIEYRHGPLSPDPDRRIDQDKFADATYFKRNFFGPGFTRTSGAIPEEVAATAPLALPTPYPPTDTAMSARIVAEMAEEAFKKSDFQKSFLFYSQLLAAQPGNRRHLLGKAGSAFHMKRYREVIEILGPIMSVANLQGFSPEEKSAAENLLQQSRYEVFSGKK